MPLQQISLSQQTNKIGPAKTSD